MIDIFKLESTCQLAKHDFLAAIAELGSISGYDDQEEFKTAATKVFELFSKKRDYDGQATLMYLVAEFGRIDVALQLADKIVESRFAEEVTIIAAADIYHRTQSAKRAASSLLWSNRKRFHSEKFTIKLCDYVHDAGLAFLAEYVYLESIAAGAKNLTFALAEHWSIRRNWRALSELFNDISDAAKWGADAVYMFGRSAVALFDEDKVQTAVEWLDNGYSDLSRLLLQVWFWRIGEKNDDLVSLAGVTFFAVALRDRDKLMEVGNVYQDCMPPGVSWRYHGQRTNIVDALFIGTQRSGTSWLWSHLSRSSDVHNLSFKEPVFFSDPFTDISKFPQELRSPEVRDIDNQYWSGPTRNLGFYKRIFENRLHRRIDISPTYCELPASSITNVARIVGADTRVVLVIRDPIDRAWSNLCYDTLEYGDPAASLSYEQRVAHYLSFSSKWRGDYPNILKNWRKYFKNNMVVIYDDILDHPETTLRLLCDFLDISVSVSANINDRVNISGDFKIPDKDRAFLLGQYAGIYDALRSEFGSLIDKWVSKHMEF